MFKFQKENEKHKTYERRIWDPKNIYDGNNLQK